MVMGPSLIGCFPQCRGALDSEVNAPGPVSALLLPAGQLP